MPRSRPPQNHSSQHFLSTGPVSHPLELSAPDNVGVRRTIQAGWIKLTKKTQLLRPPHGAPPARDTGSHTHRNCPRCSRQFANILQQTATNTARLISQSVVQDSDVYGYCEALSVRQAVFIVLMTMRWYRYRQIIGAADRAGSTSSLTVGTHPVTVTYSAVRTISGSTSTILSQVVTASSSSSSSSRVVRAVAQFSKAADRWRIPTTIGDVLAAIDDRNQRVIRAVRVQQVRPQWNIHRL